MKTFDMGSAWNDSVQLLRRDLPLTSAIVGVFLLLPAFAYAILGPPPFVPPEGAEFAVVAASLRAWVAGQAPVLLLLWLLSGVAALSVMRLWLADEGASVAEAIGFAVALVPLLIILLVLQLGGLALALMAFIVPGLYLSARWAPATAIMAAGDTRSPVEALAESWRMTQGNGWRIFAMLFLIQLVIGIISLMIDGIGSIFGSPGSAGFAVASLINAIVASGAALIGYAVQTAIYRQLSDTRTAKTFE